MADATFSKISMFTVPSDYVITWRVSFNNEKKSLAVTHYKKPLFVLLNASCIFSSPLLPRVPGFIMQSAVNGSFFGFFAASFKRWLGVVACLVLHSLEERSALLLENFSCLRYRTHDIRHSNIGPRRTISHNVPTCPVFLHYEGSFVSVAIFIRWQFFLFAARHFRSKL